MTDLGIANQLNQINYQLHLAKSAPQIPPPMGTQQKEKERIGYLETLANKMATDVMQNMSRQGGTPGTARPPVSSMPGLLNTPMGVPAPVQYPASGHPSSGHPGSGHPGSGHPGPHGFVMNNPYMQTAGMQPRQPYIPPFMSRSTPLPQPSSNMPPVPTVGVGGSWQAQQSQTSQPHLNPQYPYQYPKK